MPALFDYTEHLVPNIPNRQALNEHLSVAVAVVLILLYGANLVYSLITHRDVFSQDDEGDPAGDASAKQQHDMAEAWPLWKAIGVLVAATLVVAWEAELVSGALDATSETLGLTPFFLGVIPLAVIGNAAEYISAVYFARKNQMGMVT